MTDLMPRLNLASHPVRNRRFARTLFGTLGLVVLVFAGLAAAGLARSRADLEAARSAAVRLERQTDAARREDARLRNEIAGIQKEIGGRLDFMNGLIRRKAFSWAGLLTDLEAALPDPSYLTSFVPNLTAEGSLDLKVRVVSRDLNELMTLLDNLAARNFRGVRVESETANDRGELVSEIVARYERLP